MKWFGFLLATFALSVAIQGKESRAQTDVCTQSLIQDIGVLDLRQTESLARAELFKRSQSQDKNWATGITVPIKGVPVTGSAESAEATREQYFEASNLNWNKERLVSVATQTLSRNAVEAYRACVEGQHRSGPRILVHDATREQATVSVIWLSPPGALNETDDVKVNISGGKFQQEFPNRWITGASYSAIVDRSDGQDMRIIANIGAETDSAFISRVPPPPPPPVPSDTSLSVVQSEFWNGNPVNTVNLRCPSGSVLTAIYVDETASGGVRTPTGYRATCTGPIAGTGSSTVSVERDQIWNTSPNNDASLVCRSGSLMTSLSIDLIAVSNRRSVSRYEASCSLSGRLGARTPVRVESSKFWNPNSTNTIRLKCADGSAVSSFRTTLSAAQNLRTATYYEVNCASY